MPNDPNMNLREDEQGHPRQIDHSLEPYAVVRNPAASTPQSLAARYIRKLFKIRRVRSKVLTKGAQARRKRVAKGIDELYFKDIKQIRNLSVVEFTQYHDGIKVWKSGLTVLLNAATGNVLEAASTYDYDLPRIDFSAEAADKHTETLDEDKLIDLLAHDQNRRRLEVIRKDFLGRDVPIRKDAFEGDPEFRITKRDQAIYRFDPSQRKQALHKNDQADRNLVERALDLTLPPVDDSIQLGAYRVVTEVFFTVSLGSFQLNWHALIDQDTDSILYIRPLIDMQATGYVYDRDPLTTTGDASLVPSSPTAALNGPRTPRPLPTAAIPNLSGQYVELQEVCPIIAPPPTSAIGKFDYDADTDDFSGANAYYHSDGVFRMVEEMGFDMNVYFDGTVFPVPVDHRGSFACVNAAAWGNAGGNGLGSFTYGLVEAGQPVGIATDVRVVLHEFGHAILWDNVHSPNLGFSHSCGDSLAAVLCDPGSKAPDRFLTFPWVILINRRHDRDIAGGWAWGGVNDDGGYDSEQILATSHFRAYRALGGDHRDLCEQEWAARYVAFLMIHTVGTLTPVTNANNPEDWSERMQLCDKVTEVFEGHPGGVVHKVIRWAFEKQGAYQPPGAPMPVTTEGDPPQYDIYINDGRNGEYEFTRAWCHTKDIWNRLCPDEYPAHQAPIPGINNYAYVIVRNRGAETISGGRVRAFHKRDNACCDCCDDCADLTWPDDFAPMITESLPFGVIPPGDYQIVGPFTWKPKPGDCMLMVAEANGDPSNISFIEKGQTLLTKRLVPFDNNIALRCICKQCNPDYSKLELKHRCHKPNEPTPQG